MTEKAFQDFYADDMSHCYGCGRLNPDGLQIKSYWDGDGKRVPVSAAAVSAPHCPAMYTAG